MHSPATVLDVGCGAGREANELAKTGFSVTGADIAEALAEEAKRHRTESRIVGLPRWTPRQ